MPRIENGVFAETGLFGKAHEKALAEKNINAETSARILAGFDYEIGGETYHFGYDERDQQNFADKANECLLHKTGVKAFNDKITWNAYDASGNHVSFAFDPDDFLKLYTEGALKHKESCRLAGVEQKAALD